MYEGRNIMAATRLIALHHNRGQSVKDCLKARLDYAMNPNKTEEGQLITSYECDPDTCDKEFLLSKAEYEKNTGRSTEKDVIAYQIRQSFVPGEVTAEEANRIGYEMAMRFTKGKHAFIVATHTDRAHIHNHIIFNSTTIDCKKKFRNFYFSARTMQKISDLICLEHGLSVIAPFPFHKKKPYQYPKNVSHRQKIREDIDLIMSEPPETFEQFLQKLKQKGYEVKEGKYIALRKKGQKRFIRMRTLRNDYTEDEMRNLFSGKKSSMEDFITRHQIRFGYLIMIQEDVRNKGPGFRRWSSYYNLKTLTDSLYLLRTAGNESLEGVRVTAEEKIALKNDYMKQIKETEKKMKVLKEKKTTAIQYLRTKDDFVAYKKSNFSQKFYNEHEDSIRQHRAAKQKMNELGITKLPKISEINKELADLKQKRNQLYGAYKDANADMKEYLTAKKNVEMFLEMKSMEEINQEKEKKQKTEER